MKLTVDAIELFLRAVDLHFPTPLSKKQDLHAFALKLFEKATLCFKFDEGKISAMVAGYTDNLDENSKYTHYLSRVCHVQENTEDVDRKQWKNYRLNSLHDDFLEIIECILQCFFVQISQADTQSERHDECSHYVHGCWDRYCKEWSSIVCLTDFLDRSSWSNHIRKESNPCKVGEESGDKGSGIGY